MMVPMLPEGPDLIILVVLALLLFGGSRLAGVGKGAGRAIREFKEETDQITRSGAPSTGATVAAPVVEGSAAATPVAGTASRAASDRAEAGAAGHQVD